MLIHFYQFVPFLKKDSSGLFFRICWVSQLFLWPSCSWSVQVLLWFAGFGPMLTKETQRVSCWTSETSQKLSVGLMHVCVLDCLWNTVEMFVSCCEGTLSSWITRVKHYKAKAEIQSEETSSAFLRLWNTKVEGFR